VFDVMMAPFELESEHIEKPVTTAELARRRLAGERTVATAAVRRDVGEAVRRGAPSELRRDFYFYIMEGSWKRFFVLLIFLYVITNAFFAGLYAASPGCIDGANPDSFEDAFFFSVQTISTIGYGAMSPETAYGHVVVTIEAAIGLLGVALATGLMFAKASRPRSSTLFSDVMIVTKREGVDHLVMRVGNARGNDVVDAAASLTVLLDEFTPEGEHMRRLHTLKLVRDRTPLFALSWPIMHVIDQDSPLAAIDWGDRDKLIAIIATIIGHDGTYGQTVYARRTYYPDEIRVGHRFVDVISRMADGRMQIDYGKFHDTAPEEPPAEDS
jgi:inward rectifier potassium channel